jgi:hypothetical protein
VYSEDVLCSDDYDCDDVFDGDVDYSDSDEEDNISGAASSHMSLLSNQVSEI